MVDVIHRQRLQISVVEAGRQVILTSGNRQGILTFGKVFKRKDSLEASKRRLWRCSFCGKGKDKIRRLVAGPGVFICGQCVQLCNEVLQSEGQPNELSIGPDSEVAEVLLDELRINAAGLKQSEDQLLRAVNLLRKNQVAWSRIGEAIGTSRQAAWERFSGED
jgi:ATP-dependent Clp protease ATP-binding subunit ClpX